MCTLHSMQSPESADDCEDMPQLDTDSLEEENAPAVGRHSITTDESDSDSSDTSEDDSNRRRAILQKWAVAHENDTWNPYSRSAASFTSREEDKPAKTSKISPKNIPVHMVCPSTVQTLVRPIGEEVFAGKAEKLTPGHSWADSGCIKAVAGPDAHKALIKELRKHGLKPITVMKQQNFTVGDGNTVLSKFALMYPVSLGRFIVDNWKLHMLTSHVHLYSPNKLWRTGVYSLMLARRLLQFLIGV